MLSSPGPGKDGRTCRTVRDVVITSSPAAFFLGRQRIQDQEHKAACQLPPAGDCSFFHPATASRIGCSWQLARISSLGRSPCDGIVAQPKGSGFLLDSLGSGQHLGLSLSRHLCFFFWPPCGQVPCLWESSAQERAQPLLLCFIRGHNLQEYLMC